MFRTLDNMAFRGKRVLVRLDFDVPLSGDGRIADDFRLKKALPTLNSLKEAGARQIIMIGHIGRPDGQIVDELKTDVVAARFSQLLGEDILKLDDCVDVEVPMRCGFVLLENLRFHSEEKENDGAFAKKLASLGDVFVLEAFATAHRRHASIVGVQKFLPSCAGYQMEKEIESLDITGAKRPVTALLGAAKISDKISLVSSLLKRVDHLLLGGAAIFTFFKAEGDDVGKSMVDNEHLKMARELLKNEKIILPEDIVAANEMSENASTKTVGPNEIPHTYIGLDIGPKSVEKYKKMLSASGTIIWNGPMGKFEIRKFAKATRELAEFIACLDSVVSIIAGGWFVAPKAFGALKRLRLDMNFLMLVAVIGAVAIGEWFEASDRKSVV